MRTVFFGTPQFAVPTLEAMVLSGHAPLRVISQPSRPVGRGHRVQDPPVVVAAHRLGLEVQQVEKVRSPEFLADLRSLSLDAAVVVAFGQIFRQELLDIPRLGCFNVHASLLPKYRGAAPIQAAIAAGDEKTGITLMRMDRGLDSGPMLARAELLIGPDEKTESLTERLSVLGAGLLVDLLARLEGGLVVADPQDDSQATLAPRLVKADGEVDWDWPAKQIYDRWRAFSGWPGIHAKLRGEPLKLVELRPHQGTRPREAATQTTSSAPGTLLGLDAKEMVVACGGGTMLALTRVQRAGRGAVMAAELWRGEHLDAGLRFD